MSEVNPKRLIGLSMRVDTVPGHDERRDGLDQAWTQLVSDLELGLVPVALLNNAADPKAYIEAIALDAVILTGGNDPVAAPDASHVAPERDALERACLSYCEAYAKPILGVCRGFQMMNIFLGGSLSRITGHVRTSHPVVAVNGSTNEQAGHPIVNSYHALAIRDDNLANSLMPIYRCDDGSIEAARHQHLPWLGLMWHPERPGVSKALRQDLLRIFFAETL